MDEEIVWENDHFQIVNTFSDYEMVNINTGVIEYRNEMLALVVKTASECSDYLNQVWKGDESKS